MKRVFFEYFVLNQQIRSFGCFLYVVQKQRRTRKQFLRYAIKRWP